MVKKTMTHIIELASTVGGWMEAFVNGGMDVIGKRKQETQNLKTCFFSLEKKIFVCNQYVF